MNTTPLSRFLLALAATAMTTTALWPGAAQSAGAPTPAQAQQAASAEHDDPSGARVIVKYKALGSLMRSAARTHAPGTGPQHATTLAGRTGLALRDGRVIDRRSQVVRGAPGSSSAALAARLAADADVEYAVPDRRRHALAVPNDPLFAASPAISPAAGQWYLRAPDATFVSAINAVGAWDISTGSAAVVVADIDTGVRFDHPDLAGKLYPGYDFITDPTNAGDGTARDADASDPGDWTTANQCGDGAGATSSSWHGTQTAGLIGAQTDNGLGMASVGRSVMVLPVRVLGKCGGSDSDIIAAMLWAGGLPSDPSVPTNTHPARVLNLSLGGNGSCSQAYQDAITQLTAAGVVIVVSAGNDEGLAVSSPANCPGVIAVSGLRNVGTKVGFSSIGPEVALAAPAGNCINTTGACLYPILTTTNSGTQAPVASTYTDSFDSSLGTSFSAPLVSGTAALMISANPALTPAQLKAMLQNSARAFPTTSPDPTVLQCHAPNGVVQDECLCTTSTCGAGLLDAAAAVAAAAANAQISVRLSASANVVVVGGSIDLDGSASAATGGHTIAGYLWEITSGAGIASFAGATNGPTARVTSTGIGNFTVRLTVTDNTGQSASTSTIVTASAPAAPTVQILASSNVVAAGKPVSLDGSGSSAAAGLTVTAYQWAITSGTGLASFTGGTSSATAALATLGSGSGSVTVQLTVTDSLGRTSSASSLITVTPVVPLASISASALAVQTGTSVDLDGSGSTATTGRSITGYQWAITAGGSIASLTGSTSSSTAKVVTSGAGSFTVQLTVTDSAGAQASRSTSVTVTPAPGSSRGGGAVQVGWLLGLVLAVLALARRRRPGRFTLRQGGEDRP